MIDRRDLLKWGVAAPVLGGMPQAVMAAIPANLDGFVLDRRYMQGLAGVTAARVFSTEGDVTALWYETLDPIWRRPGFVLGGLTGPDVLFVLETLAPDRGRRVVSRKALPAADGTGPLSWVIAPVHPSMKA